MRERKELAAAQLPAPARCIHCSPRLHAHCIWAHQWFGVRLQHIRAFAIPASLSAAVAIKAAKDEAQLAETASMFRRTDPGTITTGNLFCIL